MNLTSNGGVHVKGSLSINEVITQVRQNQNFHKAGAIGIFIGVVRDRTPQGEIVTKLELEAYEEKANAALEQICDQLKEKGIIDAQIHHFLGEFGVGEDLVYVVVAGAHRTDVFSALEEAVNRYKTEAPIYKKEHVIRENGTQRSHWVSEQETP